MKLGWLASERLPELQRLIDEHWRRGHVLARDEELLRWQHPPREDAAISVLVAEEDGRLGAMLGFVPFRACAHGEVGRGGWMTNWLVVPELRGRKLGHALVDAARADFDLIGALAANTATRTVLGRAGFVEAGMYRWVRVFDVDALRELLGGRRVTGTERQAPAAEDGGEGFVGACRDADFLRRRYHEHPRFSYEVVEDGGLAAYRIETVAGSSAKVMRIVDFLGDEGLAARIAAAGEEAGAVFADFACTSARFGAALEQAGFEREDRRETALPARFQPLDFSDRPVVSCFWAADGLGGNEIFEGGDLYVTRADSDLDRPN